MDAEFVDSFLSSIQDVLATMATMEARSGEPAVKADQAAHGDITGIIGMNGEQTNGTLAISFSLPVINEIVKRMVGDGINVEDFRNDMAGEITNMVTGGAKRILSEKGYEFEMALPSVVTGEGHTVPHKHTAPVIIVSFNTEAGDFFIEICFVN